jgi:hypothetical protein
MRGTANKTLDRMTRSAISACSSSGVTGALLVIRSALRWPCRDAQSAVAAISVPNVNGA